MAVYDVMVRMTMMNGISGALTAISQQVLALNTGVGQLERRFGSLNRTSVAAFGSLAVVGGVAALAAMNKAISHGEKLIHVKEQLRAAGVKEAEVALATAKAWELSAKYGMSATNVLNDIKELRTTFGSTESAIKFLDPLEKMRVVLNAVSEGKGNEAKSAVYEMGRAGELKGLQKTEDFVGYFESMTKAISASGGLVSPRSFVQATQWGRIASKGWNKEFYTEYLPSLIQELRPTGAGAAMMSLFGTLGQGKASQRAVKQMLDLGGDWGGVFSELVTTRTKSGKLVTKAVPVQNIPKEWGLFGDTSKIMRNTRGDPVGFLPGAIKESELLARNPAKWASTVLGPLLEKKFGKLSVDNPNMILGLGGMFGNIKSAQAIASLVLEAQRIEKDARQSRQAHGTGFAPRLLTHDPTTVMNKFRDAWDNLLTAFTEPLVQPKLDIMNRISDTMNNWALYASKNPEAVERIGKAMVVLAASLTALGGAAVIGAMASLAGPAGLLVALASAIGAFGYINWNGISPGLESVAAAIRPYATIAWNLIKIGWDALIGVMKILPGVAGDVASALGKLPSLFDAIKNAISSAIDWLIGKIGSLLGFTGLTGADGAGVGGAISGAARGGVGPIERETLRKYPAVGGGFHSFAGQSGVGRTSSLTAAQRSELASSIRKTAGDLGISPEHLAAVMSFETGGTMNPWKAGPVTKWGQHRGLIQWGGPQARQYGVGPNTPISGQVAAAGRYLRDRGVKPGMGLENVYGAVIHGNATSGLHVKDKHGVSAISGAHRMWGSGHRDALKRLEHRSDARKLPFSPPTKMAGGPVIENVMVLDGEVVHRSVNKRMLRTAEHSRQAPYFNGAGMFAGPDMKFAVG